MKKILIVSLGAILLLGSCRGESAEERAARALDAQADSAMTAGDYSLAVELIDSLNRAYPLAIELRKASTAKRMKAMEQLSLKSIPESDAAIARVKVTIDSLEAHFQSVQPSTALPPYLIFDTLKPSSFAATAGIQPRVNTGEDAVDTPWTLSLNAGRDIGLRSISVSTRTSQQFVCNVTSADGQVAAASPEFANMLAKAIADGDDLTEISFIGNSTVKVKVSAADNEAIVASWQLASAREELRTELLKREKLERQLQISRDGMANIKE